jgi:hypothetical protein
LFLWRLKRANDVEVVSALSTVVCKRLILDVAPLPKTKELQAPD